MFATNSLSHVLLTELLLPKLKDTASLCEVRILTLTSVAGAICRNVDPSKLPCPREEYHGFAEYTVTKAVDCFKAQYLQRQLQNDNIVACAVHPGIIGTGLGTGNPGLWSLLYGGSLAYIFRKNIH